MFTNLTNLRSFARAHARSTIAGGLISTLALASSCNPIQVDPVKVTNFSATTSNAPSGDEMLNLSITLTTQNFSVISGYFPIMDPLKPETQYGSLSVNSSLCSSSASCPNGNTVTLGVNVDLTTFTGASGSATPTLPDGHPLPPTIPAGVTAIAIPIPPTGSKVYLAFGKGTAIVGTALTFPQLDVIGKVVPGLDLFIPISFPVGGKTYAIEPGFFGGSAPNTTGVGFFVDLSPLVSSSATMMALTGFKPGNSMVKIGQGFGSTPSTFQSTVTMPSIIPSQDKLNAFYNELEKLDAQNTRLYMK